VNSSESAFDFRPALGFSARSSALPGRCDRGSAIDIPETGGTPDRRRTDARPGCWRFGVAELDESTARLTVAGQSSELDHSSYQLLLCLLRQAGKVVAKEQLLQVGWPGRVVSENSLTKAIGRLRLALNDPDGSLLCTVHGYGYRLVVPVEFSAEPTGAPARLKALSTNDAAADADNEAKPPAPAALPGRATRRAGLLAVLFALALVLVWISWPASSPRPAKSASLPTSAPSIAVLPFVDMSPGKDQEYIADGFSEELLNMLANVPGLRVIARTSSFSFKGQSADVATIARRLHVSHVLEGSVRKSGNKIRITVQLIRADDSSHLWSQTYDRTPEDLFAVQDEISDAVVTQLKIKLLGATPATRKANPKAYPLFLQAQQLYRQDSREAYEQSIALYRQGLAIDPDYAPAWVGLAGDYRRQASSGLRPFDEGFRLAREAVNKALAIDPDYAPALGELGWIAMTYDRDLAAAARHLDRALRLEPSNADVIRNAAYLAASMGRTEQAIAIAEFGLAQDPVNSAGYNNLGIYYESAGHYAEAIANWNKAISLNPERMDSHFSIGQVLLLQDKPEAALAVMQREPSELWRLIGLSMAYHALGRSKESDANLEQLIRKYRKGAAYQIAYVQAYRGDADRTFEWLDQAFVDQEGFSEILGEVLLSNVHSDPRWIPFLRKIGKAPEQLATIRFEAMPPPRYAAR
jgi:TolB-like protein/DNA-binding winged helix-turn-helix (wHTH) protein/lipoprotein NlpI